MAVYLIDNVGLHETTFSNPNQRKLVRDSTGLLVAVYQDNAQNLLLAHSHDSGATWSNEIIVDQDTDGYATGASVCCDVNNTFHVVWAGNISGSQDQIRYLSWTHASGPSARPYVYISTGTREQLWPCIALDSSGNLHVTWQGQHETLYGTAYKIWYSTNTGGSWSVPFMLLGAYDTSYTQLIPCMAIDSVNTIHIFYQGRGALSPSQTQIKHAWLPSGGSWSYANVTNVSVNQGRPSIAIDQSDNLHLVWQYSAAIAQIYYNTKNYLTGLWGTATALTAESYTQWHPTIGLDTTGNIHVVWQGCHATSTTYEQIRYIEYTGGAWGSIQNLTSSSTGDQQFASLVWLNHNGDYSIPILGYAFGFEDQTDESIWYYGSPDVDWLERHTLTVTRAGTGSGSVTSSPVGIDCGLTCSCLFDDGTNVTLTAVPDATSDFISWSGHDSASGTTCQVLINGSDRTVTATFNTKTTPPTPTTPPWGPRTKTSTSIAVGLAQVRIGESDPYLGISTVCLDKSNSLGSMAETFYCTDSEVFEQESGFPLETDCEIPLTEKHYMDCVFRETSFYNWVTSWGKNPSGELQHSGELQFGAKIDFENVRAEFWYTYPVGNKHLYIIFPRANVAIPDIDLISETDTAITGRVFVHSLPADSSNGGNAIWDREPLGTMYWRNE